MIVKCFADLPADDLWPVTEQLAPKQMSSEQQLV
jgi:hypothetical protein